MVTVMSKTVKAGGGRQESPVAAFPGGVRRLSLIGRIALSLCFLLTSCSHELSRVTVTNATGEVVNRVLISIATGQVLEGHDLKPNSAFEFSYSAVTDTEYVVDVVFESGRSLKSGTVSLVRGARYDDRIVISPDAIAVQHIAGGK
jgi:hypothetical protein